MSTSYYFICKECGDKCVSDHEGFWDYKQMQVVYECRDSIAKCYHVLDDAKIWGAEQGFSFFDLGRFFERHEGHFISIIDEYGAEHKLDRTKDNPAKPDLVHLRQLTTRAGLASDIQKCDGKPGFKTAIVKPKKVGVMHVGELENAAPFEADEFIYRRTVPALLHVYEED